VVESGPFADEPHLWLQRFSWDEAAQTEVHGHWILTLESATLRRYVQCHQAWSDDDLVALLARCGLGAPEFHPPITGASEQFEFPVLVTTRDADGRP
jgi:hypothetical protein